VHQAAGVRHHAEPVPGRAGLVFIPGHRHRSVPQCRTSHHYGHHHLAWGFAGGDGNQRDQAAGEIINTIQGIDELSSVTTEGVSQITVTFLLERNRDIAAQDVRDKVNTVLARLPPGTDPPIIDKFDLDAVPVIS
jgi:hypothetical protein